MSSRSLWSKVAVSPRSYGLMSALNGAMSANASTFEYCSIGASLAVPLPAYCDSGANLKHGCH